MYYYFQIAMFCYKIKLHSIIFSDSLSESREIGLFRMESTCFGRTNIAVPTRVENLKPGLSLLAVPFLFHHMFLFPSLFLLPFIISASLFLTIPPFPLFTMPLLAFVRYVA